MDYLKLIVSLIIFSHHTESVIYLRPKNERGPGKFATSKYLNLQKIFIATSIHLQGAMQAGVDCIETIERYYFKNAESTQVMNLVLYHAKNISSPATEIEKVYLQGLHDRIIDQEEDEEKYYEITL